MSLKPAALRVPPEAMEGVASCGAISVLPWHYPVHRPCFRQVLDSSVEMWTDLLLCICDPMGCYDREVLLRSHSTISDTVHSEWKRVCKRLTGRGIHNTHFVHLEVSHGDGSKVMKKVFGIFAAVSLSTGVLVSQLAAAPSQPPANSAGSNTYKTACESCHGADGRGSPLGKSLHAPDLHSGQVQKQSVADLTQVITAGKNNMPPFGNRLTKDQIDAVTKYVRMLAQSR